MDNTSNVPDSTPVPVLSDLYPSIIHTTRTNQISSRTGSDFMPDLDSKRAADSIMRAEFDETIEKERAKRCGTKLLWEKHKDYIWMLVITNIDFFNAFIATEAQIRNGGYTLLIFSIVSSTFTFICTYLIVFLSVYSKKSVICFGDMIPLFSGFGYLIILAACMKYAILVRVFVRCLLACFIFIFTEIDHCPLNVPKSAKCIETSSISKSVIHGNENCHSFEQTLFIQCDGDDQLYVLSSSTIIIHVFNDMNLNYGGMLLALGILLCSLQFTDLQMPKFLKQGKVITIIYPMYIVFLLLSSIILSQGDEKSTSFMKMQSFPVQGVFEALTLGLPKISQMYTCMVSCTARLPLCTQPATDSAIVVITELGFAIMYNLAILMMLDVTCHTYNISPSIMRNNFVPLDFVPLYMALMPFNPKIFIVMFFGFTCLIVYIKQLTLLESIYSNVIWYFGCSNLVLIILYAVTATCCVCAQVCFRDLTDYRALYILDTCMHLPLLLIFGIALIIYGSDTLAADITFMTSSPPADIIKKFAKFSPCFTVVLLGWSLLYLDHMLEYVLLLFVLSFVVTETFLRIVIFKNESEAQLRPRTVYGPPNSVLKTDRRGYILDTKRICSSYAIKANALFRKFKSKEVQEDVNREEIIANLTKREMGSGVPINVA